jgi:hypothetical protein
MKTKIKFCFIIAFVFSGLFSVRGQNSEQNKIAFEIDSVRQDEDHRDFGVITNRNDTAFLNFDGGFKSDTILVILDNKIRYTRILNSDFSTSYAETISIPKTKKMRITIKLNNRIFDSFKFNKDFSTAHINYYNNKLSLTYTNKTYIYE